MAKELLTAPQATTLQADVSDLQVFDRARLNWRVANENEIASYTARESAMQGAVTRHRDGCPASRVEVSQTRADERGKVSIVRCIDCGEQVPVVAPR